MRFIERRSAMAPGVPASSVRASNILAALRERPASWLPLIAVSAIYVALYLHLPVAVFGDAGYDDAWFHDRARFLVLGHWFGPYSHTTLIKGPGYPFFLAANFLLGIPLTLGQALLQVLACALFGWATARISGSRLAGTAVFLVSLWHPYLFPPRLNRDSIYGAQSVLYLACLLHLVAPGERRRTGWALAAGASFAWLWLSREEGVWIAPATAVLCVPAAWRNRRLLKDLARAAGVAAALMALVSLGDFAAYRTWTIVEFGGGPYARAVKALQSVRVGEPQAYVPVPSKVRQAVYAVSPAFRSLRSYLEGEGKAWTNPGCGFYPSTCGDYAGGWFIWALRDAVNARGAYASPAAAARFYDQLAREVRAACGSGQLTCRSGLIGYMPAMTAGQWSLLPGKLAQLSDFLLARAPLESRPDSAGSPLQLARMWDLEGYPRRTPTAGEGGVSLAGWFHGPSSAWIQAVCPVQGRPTVAPIARLPSPDVALHFHDPAAAQDRFDLHLPSDDGCSLQLAGAGPADPALSLAWSTKAGDHSLQGASLFFDRLEPDLDNSDRRHALATLGAIAAVYKTATPILFLGAAAAWLFHLPLLALGRLRPDFYWLTSHALWLAVACRCLVLLMVDISAFPGLTIPYLSAVFPLGLAAALMTIGLPFRQRLAVAWRPEAQAAASRPA
jgi:hypothetical protein